MTCDLFVMRAALFQLNQSEEDEDGAEKKNRSSPLIHVLFLNRTKPSETDKWQYVEERTRKDVLSESCFGREANFENTSVSITPNSIL